MGGGGGGGAAHYNAQAYVGAPSPWSGAGVLPQSNSTPILSNQASSGGHMTKGGPAVAASWDSAAYTSGAYAHHRGVQWAGAGAGGGSMSSPGGSHDAVSIPNGGGRSMATLPAVQQQQQQQQWQQQQQQPEAQPQIMARNTSEVTGGGGREQA